MYLYDYQNMLDQILEMFKEFNTLEIAKFPAFKVRVYLRNKLITLGLTEDLANLATAGVDIVIPVKFGEHDELMDSLFKIADEMAILIIGFHTATMAEFGSTEIFLKMLDGTHLKIE